MTKEEKQEMAEAIRHIANAPGLTMEGRRELEAIANELDPPRPEPGTYVWYRAHGYDWDIGRAAKAGKDGLYVIGVWEPVPWDEVDEWKPARICKPDEIPAVIPLADEWPPNAKFVELSWRFSNTDGPAIPVKAIMRAEAEALHRE